MDGFVGTDVVGDRCQDSTEPNFGNPRREVACSVASACADECLAGDDRCAIPLSLETVQECRIDGDSDDCYEWVDKEDCSLNPTNWRCYGAGSPVRCIAPNVCSLVWDPPIDGSGKGLRGVGDASNVDVRIGFLPGTDVRIRNSFNGTTCAEWAPCPGGADGSGWCNYTDSTVIDSCYFPGEWSADVWESVGGLPFGPYATCSPNWIICGTAGDSCASDSDCCAGTNWCDLNSGPGRCCGINEYWNDILGACASPDPACTPTTPTGNIPGSCIATELCCPASQQIAPSTWIDYCQDQGDSTWGISTY